MYDLRRLTALTRDFCCPCPPAPPRISPLPPAVLPPAQPASSSGEVTSPEEAEGAASINYLCGVDSFGRSFMPVSGMEEEPGCGVVFLPVARGIQQEHP